MRKRFITETCTSTDYAVHYYGEQEIKKIAERMFAPKVCDKPGCNCTRFIPHEDGYQCLNCFKIIYTRNGNGNNGNGHKKNNQLILL